MSRRNAKLAHIKDLQCKHGEATLTKKDLQWMVDGLRLLDKTNFTERDTNEYNQLLQYLVNLKRG
jgi:hypothetical protein